MQIKFNSRDDWKEMQSMVARLEDAQMALLGEESGIKIEFGEIEARQNGLFLPYTIYSYCGEEIKTASVNIAR